MKKTNKVTKENLQSTMAVLKEMKKVASMFGKSKSLSDTISLLKLAIENFAE